MTRSKMIDQRGAQRMTNERRSLELERIEYLNQMVNERIDGVLALPLWLV